MWSNDITLGGGTLTSGGGTPDRGGGTMFRPVPAEFNHCLVISAYISNINISNLHFGVWQLELE